MTIGGCGAFTVPNSGIVTWKSERISRRYASNASSARSSSSIRSTGAPATSGSSACNSGRLIRKRSAKMSRRQLVAVGIAGGFRKPDRDHLRGAVPFIDRGGNVEALVALQADQLAPKRRRQHLGDLGLADAGLAFEKQRPAHAQRQIRHGRERALGEIAARGQELEHRIDRCRKCRCAHERASLDEAWKWQCHALAVAASTARRASTAIRCARYSALPCRSLFRPSAAPSTRRAPCARSASSALPRTR